ncbi:MAG: hypothetical protein ACRD7E_03480 [Bryobacteraceae bacterium]
METTSPRVAANRANAQKSTGPTSPEGKDKVSQNARSHGLTSSKLVLSHEEQAEFNRMRAGFLASYRPVNQAELAIVERIANSYWRLQRAEGIETALLDELMHTILEEHPGLDPDQALAKVFTLDSEAKKMRLFLRYRSAIEREYHRALADLRRAQKERWQAEVTEDFPENGFVSYGHTEAEETEAAETPVIPFPASLSSREVLNSSTPV